MSAAGLVIGAQIFAVLYGLAIGSFLAASVVRIPEARSLWVPSSCPRCATRLRWRDNVPVLSWAWLRGRCRSCEGPISALYPLIELLSALLALLVCRHLIQTPADVDLAHFAAWALQFGFLALLIVAATVDTRHRIIPDETSVYAIPAGIAGHALLGWLGYDGWMSIDWREAVLGTLLWGGGFAAFSWGALFLLGKEGLGWGDVKLAAMFGAFLGALPGGLAAITIGTLCAVAGGLAATLATWGRVYLPFGPPLAVGGALYVLYGDLIFAFGSEDQGMLEFLLLVGRLVGT